MIEQLVVNGCSYMEVYASGGGHIDLAHRLGIEISESIARGGSCNSRIVRTTAKHAYQNHRPSLYLLGMTFMNRWEIPVALDGTDFEGAWVNPQAQAKDRYQGMWTQAKTHEWADLNFDAHVLGMLDMLENLSYQLTSLNAWLESRGHCLLVFRQINDQPEQEMLDHLVDPRLDLFGDYKLFVNQYRWASIHWQHQQGVPQSAIRNDPPPPPEFRHRRPEHHHTLNEFLTDYIKNNTILV